MSRTTNHDARADGAAPSKKKKIAMWVVGVLLALYIIGLVNPITSSLFRYPYYVVYCGQKPVVASKFMASWLYITPDSKYYKSAIFDEYYCTAEEAEANGYQRSPVDRFRM